LEAALIKNHMSRDDQTVCGEIKAMIAFVIKGVAKEDTTGGLRGEFVERNCHTPVLRR
jgi:hypothetical protein